MVLLDGKKLARKEIAVLKRKTAKLKLRGIVPGLAVIMVGDHPASQVYVRNKQNVCAEIGVAFKLKKFSSTVDQKQLLKEIAKLNRQKNIHGIIVQLPLPKKFDPLKIIAQIDPKKDVDGLHPINLGWLALGNPVFIPATPKGILRLLDEYKIKVLGKQVVVVGFGWVAGMPMSLLLANRLATVTIAQKATKNLAQFTKHADIIISAVGVPNLITVAMVKSGAVVIDAGISKVGNKFVGDCDFAKVSQKTSYITPVPGGVGPLTVSSLIANVITAAEKS